MKKQSFVWIVKIILPTINICVQIFALKKEFYNASKFKKINFILNKSILLNHKSFALDNFFNL